MNDRAKQAAEKCRVELTTKRWLGDCDFAAIIAAEYAELEAECERLKAEVKLLRTAVSLADGERIVDAGPGWIVREGSTGTRSHCGLMAEEFAELERLRRREAATQLEYERAKRMADNRRAIKADDGLMRQLEHDEQLLCRLAGDKAGKELLEELERLRAEVKRLTTYEDIHEEKGFGVGTCPVSGVRNEERTVPVGEVT